MTLTNGQVSFLPEIKGDSAQRVVCYELVHGGMEGTNCHAYNPGLSEMLFPCQTKRLCGLLRRDSCFLLREGSLSDRHISSRPRFEYTVSK